MQNWVNFVCTTESKSCVRSWVSFVCASEALTLFTHQLSTSCRVATMCHVVSTMAMCWGNLSIYVRSSNVDWIGARVSLWLYKWPCSCCVHRGMGCFSSAGGSRAVARPCARLASAALILQTCWHAFVDEQMSKHCCFDPWMEESWKSTSAKKQLALQRRAMALTIVVLVDSIGARIRFGFTSSLAAVACTKAWAVLI